MSSPPRCFAGASMRRPRGGLWSHRDFLKLWTGQSISELGSQLSARALITALTAPCAIVHDAISFAISTAFMIPIRAAEKLPARAEGAVKSKMLPELKEGLAYVVRHPYLRPIAACTGSSNFFGSISFTIALLYLVRTLHLSSFTVGFVFAMFGVGSVVGAVVASRV